MRKRLIEKFTKAKEGTLGYTLTEMLVVIAIIAILVAIAIPSVIAITRALKFKRLNDHAKSIFMAAQQNLTEMRSDGELERLQLAEGAGVIPDSAIDPDLVAFKSEYVYTIRGRDAFNLILPAGSVEATVLEEQIIIEYNPFTGNVYAVFYSEEEDQNIAAEYADPTSGGLPRDKAARKERMLGYYNGSGLNSAKLEWEETAATVEFDNGEEGIVKVKVPVPEDFYGSLDKFAQALDIVLTVTSEFSVSESAQPVEIPIKDTSVGLSTNCYIESGNTVVVEFPIDSLVRFGSFANYASGTQKTASVATLTDESRFMILPGENITIQADVTVDMDVSDVLVKVSPGVIANINPMFAFLQESSTGTGYDLGVANGRHLQNLNAIAPTLADQVVNVMFTHDIDWNATVTYYNNKYEAGETYHTGTPIRDANNVLTGYTYDEAPARALPYFVPIHNAYLFGSATFIYPGEDDSGLGNWLQQLLNRLWEALENILEVLFGGFINKNVPTLTDELDAALGNSHATIQGAGHKVYNLNIDSTKYKVPDGKFYTNQEFEYEVKVNGRTEKRTYVQEIDYNFTGLFGYVNTPINGLKVVNPVVKGRPIVGKSNPATGGLVGVAGYNTVITNCGVYVDKDAVGYMGQYLGHKAYSADTAQTWYGVSGEGSVGGLVGYAKSHRTITESAENNGALLPSEDVLAFSHSFAAVPVSGNMRSSAAGKDYGYSNGVGGFIGNSELTNFYSCYASGDVIANNCFISRTNLQGVSGDKLFGTSIELPYDGRKSWGAGGFVGTSHGTRYTNCFATGDVTATTSNSSYKVRGAGGFVGFMSIDETSAYGNESTANNGSGNDQIVQRTVFTNCYSVGLASNGGRYENFSGANGRIVLDLNEFFTYFIGDYYRLYAPYQYNYRRDPAYGDSAYIYRDTYYLNHGRKTSGDLDTSRTCAEPVRYEILENLPAAHVRKSDFAEELVDQIKSIKLIGDWDILGLLTYKTVYFWRYSALENLYYDRLAEGYSANEWEPATAATTHPYTTSAGGAVYPFSKLKGMDYYGDWPAQPSDVGMAYYEQYEGDDQRYYLFDKEYEEDSRLTLKDGETDLVVKDGYAIFSINNITSVTAGGKTFTTANKGLTATTDTFSLEGQSFKAYLLSDEFLDLQPAEGEFYIEVKVKDSKKTYTMYFNPNTARTHVNPANGAADAAKPDSAPTVQYVRSARQLKALSNLGNFLTDDYRYIQQLNIDATKYKGWASTDRVLASIGSAQKPFNASYTAGYTNATGEAKQHSVSGFRLNSNAAGIFGVIGADGGVEDMIINTDTITAGGNTVLDGAVLAGRNEGLIYNVDLNITGAVSLTAQNNAGLLAGYNSGSLRNCEVTAAAVTLKAENCGGLIGSAVGTEANKAQVTGCKLTLTGTLNATDTNTLRAGGMIGYGEYLSVTGAEPMVTMTGMSARAEYAGGLAGYLKESSVQPEDVENQVTVKATAALSNPNGYMAGFLGGGENVTANGVDVTMKSLAGKKAAGFLGAGTGIQASYSEIVIEEQGSVTGLEQAAGVACSIATDSYFSYVPVTLKNVTVSAETGDAAGFAVEATAETDIIDCVVTLGGAAKIKGGTSAAGFACRSGGYVLHTSGASTFNSVVGHGEISAPNAAGFACNITGQINNAYVTPAVNTSNYMGNSNSNLKVIGTGANGTAAGFALHVGRSGIVQNCYALNEIQAATSCGFATNNEGTINGCMANVTINGGHAFVADNKGTVSRSYGWYGDGNITVPTTTIAEVNGDCVSAYFADLKPVDDEGQIATLYTADGEMQKLTAAELQTAVNLLANTTNKWYTGGYASYPYAAKRQAYRYPMLRDHYGEWLEPPVYAFGLAYYETYNVASDNGTKSVMKMHMVDLTGGGYTKEGSDVSAYLMDDAGTVTVTDSNIFNNDYTIASTGYAVFSKKGQSDLKSLRQGSSPLFTYTLDRNQSNVAVEYEFYALNTASAYNGVVTVESSMIADGVATVKLYFADAVNANGTYYVRTPAQLEKVGTEPSANFHQTHDITAGDFTNMKKFSGTYNGHDVKLTVTGQANTWMTEVSGKVESLKLDVSGGVNKPVFGTVSGNVALSGLNVGAVGTAGALAESVSGSMTVPAFEATAVNGKLFGNSTGTITATGGIKVAGNAAQLFGNVKNVTVQGDISVGSAANTKVFGDVSGTVSTKAILVNGTAAQVFGVIDAKSGNTVTVDGAITVTGSAAKVFGDVKAPVTVNGLIRTGSLSGNAIGTVDANMTLNGITVDTDIAQNNCVIAGVNSGNVSTGAVTVQTVNGSVFGKISGGEVETGAITAAAVSGQIFNDVEAKTTVASIDVTGAANQIFGSVKAEVQVTDGIRAASATQVFGEATAKINTGDIQITGNAGTIFSGVAAVDAKNITVGGNATKIFGNTNGIVKTKAISVTGTADQVFGNITGGSVTVDGAISAGTAKQIFGTVNAAVEVKKAISIGTLNGNAIGAVSANLTLNGITVNGELAQNNHLIAAVSNGNVSTGAVSLQTVNGNVFGEISGGQVTTGTISTGTVEGQIFGNVSGTVYTKAITVEGKADQVFGTINAKNGNTVTVDGAITVNGTAAKVFGDVKAPVTVNALIKTGNLTDTAIGTVSADMTLKGITVGEVPAGKRVITAISGGTVSTGAINTQTVGTAGETGAANIFGDITGGTVTIASISTNSQTVNGSVFGNIGAQATKVTVNGGITTGVVTGNVFGAVNAEVSTGAISTGTVKNVFGAVAAKVTVNGAINTGDVTTVFGNINGGSGVTVNGAISTGNVTTHVFDTVKAEVNVTGGISVGDAPKIFGEVSANVTTASIKAGAVSGNIITNVNSGVVTTGAIEVTSLTGQLAGQVKGTLQGDASTAKEIKIGTDVTLGKNLVGTVSGNLKNYRISVSAINVSAVSALTNTGTIHNVNLSAQTATLATPVLVGSNGGNITKSSVSVGTVTISKPTGNIGVLANEVASGKTISDSMVVVDSLTISEATGNVGILVGKNSGTVSGSTVTKKETGLTATLSGKVVGGLVGENAGTLTGNTVTIGTLTANGTDATVGGLVGINSGKIAVVDSKGNATVDGTTKVTITTLSGGKTVGGLAGTNSGTINCSNTTKTVDIAITTGASKVGGLTATNSGTITGTNVTANISYTGTGGTIIGGIVGENSGAMSSATVSGTITPGTLSNKANIIGGAVGKASEKTTYSNITSTVAVGNWGTATLHNAQNADAIKTIVSPNGNGPVGQFVGYAATGTSFTNCSGNGGSATYQFLGQVQHASTETFKEGTYGGFDNTMSQAPYTQADKATYDEYKAQNNAAGVTIVKFNVTLSECYYTDATNRWQQTIGNTKWYSDGKEGTYDSYTATPYNPTVTEAEKSKPTVGSFSAHTSQSLTAWYYKHTDGNYYPVWARYDYYNGLLANGYGVELWADLDMNGSLADSENIDGVDEYHWQNTGGNKNSNLAINIDLVKLSGLTVKDGNYMIVGGGGKTLSNSGSAVTFKERFDARANADLTASIWNNTAGVWSSNGKYLNLNGSMIGSQNTIKTGIARAGASGLAVSLNGGKYLTYNGSKFDVGSKQIGAISLYSVSSSPVYEMTFTNDRCGQVINAQNKGAIPASISEEIDNPAGNGGETGNNT